jgi:DMSO/TMAO reductase YedYZ molybdopterin-dependent catalytic subunit
MTRRQSIIATVVAAGVSLGVSELLAGLGSRVPSAISSVGTFIVDNAPTSIERWAIDTFGTNDKTVLAIGTILVVLAVAAYAGTRVHRAGFRAGVPWFVLFGAIGLAASLAQALVSVPMTLVSAVLTVGSGLLALRFLLSPQPVAAVGIMARPGPDEEPTDGLPADVSRRIFVSRAAGLGAAATVGGLLGRRLLTAHRTADVDIPTATDTTAPLTVGPENRFLIEGLDPIVIPNDRFYRIDTALVIPRISVDDWTLSFTGLVDQPYEITFDELASGELVEDYVTIACVSNEVGGGLVGNAKWRGVPLANLLDRARPTAAAEQVVGWSVDGWASGFPIEAVYDGRQAIVAIAMNDEPLPARHGFPARLIVPGLYGYVSATKWLDRIELTTWDGFDSYWVPRGWAKEGPIKTQSRIDVPRRNGRVPIGETAVAGVAWAPLKGITKVEVQLDEGAWQEAELTEPLSNKAWVQWKTSVMIEQGPHELKVRATDGSGETQTSVERPPAPDGATGWHTIRVVGTV